MAQTESDGEEGVNYGWTSGQVTGIKQIKLLNYGGFSEVHEMRNERTGQVFARKLIRPFGSLTRKDILNEARAITKLCVAKEACHLVQVMAHGWLQESSDYYYIDMELCDMTLAEHIDSVDSPVVYWQKTQHTPEHLKAIRRLIENIVFITESITLGLRYIHNHGEVHRDIKPSNVLYCRIENQWKIGDFGTSSEATSKKLVTTQYARGTACYRASEVILSNLYNNKADMWALGCIIYELCTGEKAFLGDWAVLNYATAEHSTSLTLFPSEWTSDCTVGAFFRTLNSWTGNLLRRVPNERPSADRLVTIWGDLKPLLNPSDNSEEWFSLAIKAKEGVSTTKSRTGLFPFPPAFVSMEEIRHGLDTAVALQQKTEVRLVDLSLALQDWLRPISTMDDDFDALRRSRAPDTADWLYYDRSFIRWNEDRTPESRLLLIHGPPGCGKSVLAANVIDKLRRKEDVTSVCVYSFIRHDDQMKRDLVAILRTFVFDLAAQIPEYKDLLGQSFERGDITSTELDSVHHLWQSLIVKLLEKTKFTGTVQWVIDGLDEGNTDSRRMFLEYFEDLRYLNTNFKILVFSRYSAELVERFRSASGSVVEVTQERTSADIRAVISHHIQCSELLNAPNIVLKIWSRLETHSGGIFLWVRVIFEALGQLTTEEEILDCLNSLPTGLTQMYQRAFLALSKDLMGEKRKLSQEIFQWTISAFRPLSFDELSHALLPKYGRLVNLSLEIKRCCGGLVIIESGTVVRMVHFTVAEFLRQPESMQFLDPAEAHEKALKACLDTIPLYDKASQPIDCEQLIKECPLLRYGSVYWPFHVRSSVRDGNLETLKDAVMTMLTSSTALTWVAVTFFLGESVTLISAVDELHNWVDWGEGEYADVVELIYRWKTDIQALVQEVVGLLENYEGEMKDGLRHGYGTCIYEIGDRYEGQWVDGRRNGYGILNFINGNRHEGWWKRDKQDGECVWTFSDKVSYRGIWEDGIGQPGGVWTFPDGHSTVHEEDDKSADGGGLPDISFVNYKGSCTVPLHDATGRFGKSLNEEKETWIYPNGSIYTGGWEQGKETGYGDWICVCGSEYHGEWQNGLEDGVGTWITRTGKVFTGNWKEGWENGFGVLRFPTGDEHRGYWKDGKPHGSGRVGFVNGNQYIGQWILGKLRGRAIIEFGSEWLNRSRE